MWCKYITSIHLTQSHLKDKTYLISKFIFSYILLGNLPFTRMLKIIPVGTLWWVEKCDLTSCRNQNLQQEMYLTCTQHLWTFSLLIRPTGRLYSLSMLPDLVLQSHKPGVNKQNNWNIHRMQKVPTTWECKAYGRGNQSYPQRAGVPLTNCTDNG